MENHIRIFYCRPCSGYADTFDFTIGLFIIADTGGVDDVNRDALHLNRLGYFIARGTRNRRDDSHLRTCKRIQQGTFSNVRLSCQYDI